MVQLEFENASFSANGKSILNDFSVRIDKGEYISIVGPSGSGKSTFLKLCSHLISPSAGRILFEGKDLMEQSPTEIRKRIGYCFQTPVLFGETVEDNLKYPYTIRKENMNQERVISLFDRFNLSPGLIKEPVCGLSGGEKQRIALIRTLLFKPDILLLDEVTSALDVDNTAIVEEAVDSLNKQGITVLWVTHNPEQSKRWAGKLLTVENGQIKSLEVLR